MAYTLQAFAEAEQAKAQEPMTVPDYIWPKWALASLILLVAIGVWAARYRARHEREELVFPRGT